jgi:RHS repeat-associated protein
LALQSIKRWLDRQAPMDMQIFNSASTQKGFSLTEVAELSRKVGLNYQMALRHRGAEFVIPSVVHWKVGHYAALVRQIGDRYLLEDPTFGNTVWATRSALETETSGYFLIPPGELPRGWRSVDAKEGNTAWGKGVTSGNDPDIYTPEDLQTSCGGDGIGMAVSRVHLMLANLQVRDTPVGYTPPVGPPVRFTLRYNHRDSILPGTASSGILGWKWTHDWRAFITDTPRNPLADVRCNVGGGGVRTFTGFDPNTQSFEPQQYDQTLLKRIGTNILTSSYEMLFPDGSKKIFGHRQNFANSAVIYLTAVIDPAGNAITFSYDQQERLVAVIDAIGQVTTISYEHSQESTLITKVTDPFGRFATFDYESFSTVLVINGSPQTITVRRLNKITDVLGLVSRFEYAGNTDIVERMITPYGTNTFTTGQSGTVRWVETVYPDGSRERVEFNQTTNLVAFSEPPNLVPQGVSFFNQWLHGRNTYYWNRTACATAYRDFSKAQIFHWLHTGNGATTSGILESTKAPLERRVWYNYPGQSSAAFVGASNRPRHIGRVLDDTTTQLYTYGYNAFGRMTNSVDPLGRTLSSVYASNSVDLLQVRQTRGTNNELLSAMTYNNQHRPLTVVDAAGQTNRFTYNARGQLLSATNPKNETTTYTYDANGYLISVDGPLSGTNDTSTATYDGFGRVHTMTDVSGYTLTFDYDAMNRVTRITHPDATFSQYTYERFHLAAIRDRAGRQTFLEHDNIRQLQKRTDPLGRVTLFLWCNCGGIKGLTDPMGRTTEWHMDIQGRPISKRYPDGSQISYFYENATSRLREIVDEKGQRTQFTYNRDNTLHSRSYANASRATPAVHYTYDPNYERILSMTDGTGTTLYSYTPITAIPTLGAGRLASVDGPLANDTIIYGYDELGRPAHRAINSVDSSMTYDAAGRVTSVSNVVGAFAFAYDASSRRLVSKTFPNGQTEERNYGSDFQDRTLQRITYRFGATPISEFVYGHNIPAGRIATWSQQADVQSPNLHTLSYDNANQLTSVTVSNAGALVSNFAYAYDPAGNRLFEQVGVSNSFATYNTLNQISTTSHGVFRTNEWDAVNRLVAITAGNQRTEFTYDGLSRMVGIRRLINNSEVSQRRFVWSGNHIAEERDGAGAVTKRFFGHAMKLETGSVTGVFFYTRDHLGSIRELADSSGAVRARYAYDPYGRRVRLAGDVDADFGFAGMFWSAEANLYLTHFRAYDPELGRWLSRDPLRNVEIRAGPNLYAYVVNDPINRIDPSGLISTGPLGEPLPCLTTVDCVCLKRPAECIAAGLLAGAAAGEVGGGASVAPRPMSPLTCPRSVALPEIPSSLPQPEPIPSVETLPDVPTAALAETELEIPALAETQVAETTSTSEANLDNWLRQELERLHNSPGHELLPSEHTRELALAIIERHRLLSELAAARAEIASWLSGLPDLW